MIAASEPQEYVPFGRQHMGKHPGPVYVPVEQRKSQGDTFLSQKFSKVNLNESLQQDEFWTLKESNRVPRIANEGGSLNDVSVEEELYVCGHTVVISRGNVGLSTEPKKKNQNGGRQLIISYTMETPIKHALWCAFSETADSPRIPSICIIDSQKISVFSENGPDYTTPLQFKVAGAWNTKFGLILERVAHSHVDRSSMESCGCEGLTTMFSLLHPLDEISPILIVKQGGTLSYMNDACYKILYTGEDPSICLLYNIQTGLHTIWKIRKSLPEECQWMCGQESGITMHSVASHTTNTLNTSSLHLSSSVKAHPNRSSLFGGSPKFTKNASTIMPHSPNSPLLYSSTKLNASKFSHMSSASSIEARMGSSVVIQGVEPKPIVPQLCFEYLRMDGSFLSVPGRSNRNCAKTVFMTSDAVGQQYLCFHVDDCLSIVRLTQTNDKKTPEIIIGTVSQIQCKDAISIPALNMIAAIELGGSVVLYTGPTLVGKLHIAGISAELASVSYLSNMSLSAVSMNTTFPDADKKSRIATILSSTRVNDVSFDDQVLLSPVHSTLDESPGSLDLSDYSNICKESLCKLRDPVNARFTFEYSNGSMFRFTLPAFASSPLVQNCVQVLKHVLKRDVALMTLAKWYTIRNAPGTQDITPNQEWHLFLTCIFGLMGYDIDGLSIMNFNSDCDTPAKNTKKMKASDQGTEEDFNILLNSLYHAKVHEEHIASLGLKRLNSFCCQALERKTTTLQVGSQFYLFQYNYLILYSFHLLYEDFKLKPVMEDSLPLLNSFLKQLSGDLRLWNYVEYYWRDFPCNCPLTLKERFTKETQITDTQLAELSKPQFITDEPCSVFEQIYILVKGGVVKAPFPHMKHVNDLSRNILEIIGLMTNKEGSILYIKSISKRIDSKLNRNALKGSSPVHKAVLLMNQLGIKRQDLLHLPSGLGIILGSAVQSVTENPDPAWGLDACRLISRLDLYPHKPTKSEIEVSTVSKKNDSEDLILRLRFNKDQRVDEVKKLLQSSEPVNIGIVQRPEVNDHEFIEEQERHLYAICTRTMALPVGRGMLYLHTTNNVVITEQLNIPKLCLSGRAPPRGTTVELSHIEVVPNMNLWPSFHNGVAAGIKISPNAQNIDSTWILYNKPKNGTEALPEHAGFLMGLGLTGHLNNLMDLYLYKYLNKCHEMTSVGILLGLAASKRGTMDVRTTKLFSLHIESLLPPTSIELDLVQNIQVAALLGIGLLYQGTGQRHIAEALLSEIGRPPGPEMENSSDRECYSLAAGLGLGLVVLEKGKDPTGLGDLDLADTLQYYMIGGHKRPLTGSQKEKYKSPSYQIREGDCVNNHVTGPGATLALAMMYFRSGNMAVADWLKAPDSEYMLDFICPDQLLLRIMARGLILWDTIEPTEAWVEQQIPSTILPYVMAKPTETPDDVDLETMTQAYCNIVAGACMAMAFRFASSANEQAFHVLMRYCKMFTSMSSKTIAELAGKSTIETCICVMAGTGDLDVLRLCRHLGSRVGPVANSLVTYGSHLAIHMSLGLLFLGGGSLALSTRPEAVAAMICAFFPRFPTHSNDNRYHLQAFRHLYVLAVEPRLFLPRDIDSNTLCYANLNVVYLDSPYYKNQKFKMFAPCLLPELHYLKQVTVEDDRYWPIGFSKDVNWDVFEKTIRDQESVGVKLRAGCLPYLDDPYGYKTLLAQTLSNGTASSWNTMVESIQAFISDSKTLNFTNYFLGKTNGEDSYHETDCEESDKENVLIPECNVKPDTEPSERGTSNFSQEALSTIQLLSHLSYDCITNNKLPLLDYWIKVVLDLMKLNITPSTCLIWQLKLILAHIEVRKHIKVDHITSFSQQIGYCLDKWRESHSQLLRGYLSCSRILRADKQDLVLLAAYLTFYDIPNQEKLMQALQQTFPQAFKNLKLNLSMKRMLWDIMKGS